jgi:putative oxidoreductase
MLLRTGRPGAVARPGWVYSTGVVIPRQRCGRVTVAGAVADGAHSSLAFAHVSLLRSSPNETHVRHSLLAPASGVPRHVDIGLLIVRVFAGLALAFAHGIGKVPPSDRFIDRVAGMGLPAPELFAWLAGAAEFGAALLLALGLLTRPAAFLILGNFVVVAGLAHAGDSFGDREKPLLFLTIALLYLFAGPGRYSLDAVLFRDREGVAS